jgi:pantoate--beta-alanine ligase
MKVIRSVRKMTDFSGDRRRSGGYLGFVPTMGFLHDGHMSLVRSSKTECDLTAVSIFVNPAQFCPGEDLEKYPRDIDRDISLLEAEKADIVFIPDAGDIYPKGYSTYVDMAPALTQKLCGLSRPGHFRGVATIVAKLLNLVDPDKLYLGHKDFQQAIIIERMVRDLGFRAEVRVMPTVRESDGLAMSSRNKYLSPENRRRSGVIYKSLEKAREAAASGEKKAADIRSSVENILLEEEVKIDYIEIVDPVTLESIKELDGKALVAVAVFIGGTRLIDNMVITSHEEKNKT